MLRIMLVLAVILWFIKACAENAAVKDISYKLEISPTLTPEPEPLNWYQTMVLQQKTEEV